MTMAIRPVSTNVRFGDNPVDLERNGAFAADTAIVDDGAGDKFEKSGSTKKVAAYTAAGLVVALAALAGLAKGKVLNELTAKEMKDAGIFKKAGHYLAKAGNWIADNTYGRIAKLFSGEEKAAKPAGTKKPKKPAKPTGGEKPAKPKKGEKAADGEKPAKPKKSEKAPGGEKPAKPKKGEKPAGEGETKA